MDLLAAAMMAMIAASAAPAGIPMPGMAAAVPCPGIPTTLPAELAGWTRMTPVRAGASAGAATALMLGTGARASLLPTRAIAYALPPHKPGEAASNGGLFAFTAPAAGRYRVAIGAAAWIDVVRNGGALAASAHAHGPACSGIRKMVDFDLQPGRYLLQITDKAAPTLALIVIRLP